MMSPNFVDEETETLRGEWLTQSHSWLRQRRDSNLSGWAAELSHLGLSRGEVRSYSSEHLFRPSFSLTTALRGKQGLLARFISERTGAVK